MTFKMVREQVHTPYKRTCRVWVYHSAYRFAVGWAGSPTNPFVEYIGQACPTYE
ncbi:hypothetical protein QDY71_06585 [Kingella negevensis]|uniref:hypothetical protein n=1 Tax=Kingella negevensis TaxID=1522312 RepID=UPI002551A491|nr:hypothetical protein [Kingella negevensis]MDK4685123.1 hypothetical protein [Kingella negevensis]MDK4697413.1 hypothetical protein [Kingella negevensis]MDK4706681.1 hypothetical protein [Kingella negevensis]MDK4709012.1 hypothetical protein [Kingella negevensis]